MTIKTTTILIVTSIFRKNLGETKGKRPEPITVLTKSKIAIQKKVVLMLALKNFFKLTLPDQPRRKRKGAVTEVRNLER